MKTKGSTAWVFTTMVAVVLFMGRLRKFSEKKGTGESSGNRATR